MLRRRIEGPDWGEFLGRSLVDVPASLIEGAVRGRRILITGAGGSIGSELAHLVAVSTPEVLLMLDLSEHALYESHRRIAASAQRNVVPIVGSVCDRTLLHRVLSEYSPDLVIHAAAYKHVPLMEQNPFSAIENNAVGTLRLILAACEHRVRQLLMVSTDKAVRPCSVMGASKRLAELVLLSHSHPETSMQALRLGNVLGSSGSVSVLFQEQLRLCVPLTVTDANVERYFLTIEEAEAALLEAVIHKEKQGILVAECGTSRRVLDLAHFLARQDGRLIEEELEIEFVGLRPGDKLREELVGPEETVEEDSFGNLHLVHSPHPDAIDVAYTFDKLQSAIRRADLGAMMTAVMGILPEYKPGNFASSLTEYK